MSKIILHIDLNTFFVRCEEIKNPSLIGKPVAIGSEGRAGIVSTCSYEARKYGVSSGMPMFQAKSLCKDLIILPPDGELIRLLSKEFISHIRKFSEIIEQISCDECYVDITESFKKYGKNNIYWYLKNIQNTLYNKTKLKCSIGVGPTKFLAKMGSDYKKPMGITIIRKKDIKKILFPLDVSSFYGIGKKTAPKLYKLGIKTIGDLYYKIKLNIPEVNETLMDQKFYILDCLEGRSSDKVNIYLEEQKSIGTTRTLENDSSSRDEIRNFYMKEVDRIIKDMKKEGKLTKTIQLTIKDASSESGFKTNTFSKTIGDYTDSERKIKDAALKLFENSFKNQTIRLIGFSVKNLINRNEAVTQMTFDDYMIHEKESETFLLINKLNRQFNKDVLIRASDLKKKHGN